MKSKKIFLPALILCLYFHFSSSKAQLIDNKLNIYIYKEEFIQFNGDKLLKENNFIFPSLYSGFYSKSGYSFKILYKSFKNISWGIESEYLKASGWECGNYLEFKDAKIGITSISPVFQFHTGFSKNSFFKRGKMFLEVMPSFGYSHLTFSGQFFEVKSIKEKISAPFKSNDPFYGYKGSVGIEWSLTQHFGSSVSYAFGQSFLKSSFYCDTQFAYSQINIGLFLKIFQDKYYLYQ